MGSGAGRRPVCRSARYGGGDRHATGGADGRHRASGGERGRHLILNAAPARELAQPVLSNCDVLVVNEHELRVVTGNRSDSVEQAHAALIRRGVGAVVTTLGAAGAVFTDVHGTETLAAFPAEVVDTTGAGDAFTGALAARLAVQASLAEAVRWGTAAGSLAVRRAGAQESLPDLTDVRFLLEGEAPR